METGAILGSSGKEVGRTPWFQDRVDHTSLSELPICLAKGNTHVEIAEQPAGRYLTFQLLEATLVAALTTLFAAFALCRIRRRPA
ncbi:hypothetical protein PUR61_40920 [Streptomyces sp. BE20]|uniref:hypothetical protein n=1 Tax=Streptomyces sp. BE20 TaxID=3002525 RepID=UPI002E765D65|nr:hypothetical protein [Streptomyces sp. BE20]MEE1828485.1 hypothetical protein [Streptomyces sp. BE20]